MAEKKYIDAEKGNELLVTEIYKNFEEKDGNASYRKGIMDVANVILNMPAADVAEVRHGHWIKQGLKISTVYSCSICGTYATGSLHYLNGVFQLEQTDYCPYCGAKMDGGKE